MASPLPLQGAQRDVLVLDEVIERSVPVEPSETG